MQNYSVSAVVFYLSPVRPFLSAKNKKAEPTPAQSGRAGSLTPKFGSVAGRRGSRSGVSHLFRCPALLRLHQ